MQPDAAAAAWRLAVLCLQPAAVWLQPVVAAAARLLALLLHVVSDAGCSLLLLLTQLQWFSHAQAGSRILRRLSTCCCCCCCCCILRCSACSLLLLSLLLLSAACRCCCCCLQPGAASACSLLLPSAVLLQPVAVTATAPECCVCLRGAADLLRRVGGGYAP